MPLLSFHFKPFFYTDLDLFLSFKDLEVGPKHFGEEVQMLQVGKKDPDLLSTPVKTSASSSPSALSPPGQAGQYNSPVGLYSAETLREMMMMQGNLGQGSTASLGVSSLW